MDKKDLPSSSDESDEDFIPKDEENSDTGSEGSDYETPDGEDENFKNHKRKVKTKKSTKKAKINHTEKITNNEVQEEKKEIDVDALWADFKKDVDSLETKKTAENYKTASEKTDEPSQCSGEKNNFTDSKRRSDFSFPSKAKARIGGGGGGGGLSKVLSQIGKKEKMSTLQKSQLDWNKFKKSEGLEEEIKIHNKGKDGYLEKQDFLQRTDLRQFEIEKELRSARRKF